MVIYIDLFPITLYSDTLMYFSEAKIHAMSGMSCVNNEILINHRNFGQLSKKIKVWAAFCLCYCRVTDAYGNSLFVIVNTGFSSNVLCASRRKPVITNTQPTFSFFKYEYLVYFC